jgi:hypothetical protein
MKMPGSIHTADSSLLRGYSRPRRGMTLGHGLVLAAFLPIFVMIEAGNRMAAALARTGGARTPSRPLLATAVAEAKIAISYIFIGRDMMK